MSLSQKYLSWRGRKRDLDEKYSPSSWLATTPEIVHTEFGPADGRSLRLSAVRGNTVARDIIATFDEHRGRNARPPIHTLPRELFIHILKLCLKDPRKRARRTGEPHDPASYYKELGRYMQVSYLWADAIKKTPSLWSYVHSSFDTVLLQQIARHCGQHPLDLEVARRPPGEDRSAIAEKVVAFGEVVWGRTAQWRSVRLGLDDVMGIGSILVPLKRSLPQLVEFKARRENRRLPIITHVIDIGNGQVPERLKTLVFDGVAAKWDSLELRGLQKFALKWIQDSPATPNLRHLINTVTRSPDLEEFVLEFVPHIINQNVDDLQPISLPKLKHFRLKQLNLQVLSKLLGYFREAPNVDSMEVLAKLEPQELDGFSFSLPDYVMDFLRKLIARAANPDFVGEVQFVVNRTFTGNNNPARRKEVFPWCSHVEPGQSWLTVACPPFDNFCCCPHRSRCRPPKILRLDGMNKDMLQTGMATIPER